MNKLGIKIFSKIANIFHTRIRPYSKQLISYQTSEFQLHSDKLRRGHSEGGIAVRQGWGEKDAPAGVYSWVISYSGYGWLRYQKLAIVNYWSSINYILLKILIFEVLGGVSVVERSSPVVSAPLNHLIYWFSHQF